MNFKILKLTKMISIVNKSSLMHIKRTALKKIFLKMYVFKIQYQFISSHIYIFFIYHE